MLRVRSHNSSVLFQTPFDENTWHNFAVAVDWDNLMLQVFYSQNASSLTNVTNLEDNSSAVKGPNGQGDFHFGLLKVCLSGVVTGCTFRTHLLTRARRIASVD
jgi:hypothetical protein